MLTAYFDEAYNHRTEKNRDEPLVYTVACWLSTEQKWLLFAKKWRFALNRAGVDFFHMTDFEARRGAYESWPQSKRVGFLKELHSIIKTHVLFGCSSSINCADYDAEFRTTPAFADYFGRDYYDFNVRVCLKLLNQWCDENGRGGDPVRYVFAELAKQGRALDRIFKEVLASPDLMKQYRMVGMWEKGIMRETLQLQAADVVAYELNKRAVNNYGLGPKFVRKSLDNLALSKNFAPRYFDRNELAKWAVSSFTGLNMNPNPSRRGA